MKFILNLFILNLFIFITFSKSLIAHVIMLDGVPASGKSTLEKKIQSELNFVLVEADQIALSRNPDQPNWVEGLDLGWEEVHKLHKSGKSVVFDAWFDKRHNLDMEQVSAKTVLVFLRLDILLHRYTQRRLEKPHKVGTENPADYLTKDRIHHLTEDYFKRFYFASESKDPVLVHFPTGLNLYSRRPYDLIVDSGEINLDSQLERVRTLVQVK
jgi:hypothetical protein